MARGLDSRPTSKESNDGKTGIDIGWRRCPSFVGEWGKAIRTNTVAEAMAIRDGLLLYSLEAQQYLDRHHEMSRAHHSHHASVLRRESNGRRPCNAWSLSHVPLMWYIIMPLVTYHSCGTHLGNQLRTEDRYHEDILLTLVVANSPLI
ncbi:unnamed protein product [Spirodela intermedia]|uniref:Uncharacterized protein n=1 Tax=Spirodela intermedia TaxID=51605 RepID=A0A7I8L6S8_SPIIN|nr:unnamed protein product [Spirodela intermedia]